MHLLVPLLLALVASRHPGASIWGEIVVLDDAVLFTIEGAADPFQTCLRLPHLPIGPLPEDDLADDRAALEAFARDELVLKVDGIAVAPVLEEFVVSDGLQSEGSWRSTSVKLRYACAAPPQRVTVVWPRFEGEGVDYVSVVIRRGPKGPPRMFTLLPKEPEHTWHDSGGRARAPRPPAVPQGGGGVEVAVPSLAALLVAAAGLVVAARRTIPGVALLALGLLAAVALKDVGRVEVDLPFRRRTPLPAESQAKDLVASLVENVYRAFAAQSEGAIYDLLAESVDAALLDDLYGQVYESLILADQGGAMCSVDSVDVVEGKVDLAAAEERADATFTVDWRWQVQGSVAHWGHVHRRMNEYHADLDLRHDGEGWKIAAIRVKDQKRIEES